ncbi:MAG: DUF4126 family protein [Specibacter sp.]
MEAAITAALMAIGAGSATGLRPYLTVVFLGIVGLVTPDEVPGIIHTAVSQIPEFLSNPLVLIVCGILALADTSIDKMPGVNVFVGELIQRFIRPAFGIFVGIQLGLDHGTIGMVTTGLLGAVTSVPVALGKTSSTTVLGGIPGIQLIRSLGEEAIVIVLLVAAIVLPLLAAFLGLIVVAAAAFIFVKLRRVYRSTRMKFGQFSQRRLELKEIRRVQLESGERLSMPEALRQAIAGVTPTMATGMAGAASSVARAGTNAAAVMNRAGTSAAGGMARAGSSAADSTSRAGVNAAAWTKESGVAANAKQAANTVENAFRAAQQRAADLATVAAERARSAVKANVPGKAGVAPVPAPELPQAIMDTTTNPPPPPSIPEGGGSEVPAAPPHTSDVVSKQPPLPDARLSDVLPSREEIGAVADQALTSARSQIGKLRGGISSRINRHEENDAESEPKKSALSRIRTQAGDLRKNLVTGTAAGVVPEAASDEKDRDPQEDPIIP